MILWRIIQVVVYMNGSFLFVTEWFSIVWMSPSLFNHLFDEGHLGCFQFGAIMNKVAINISGQVCL